MKETKGMAPLGTQLLAAVERVKQTKAEREGATEIARTAQQAHQQAVAEAATVYEALQQELAVLVADVVPSTVGAGRVR